MTKTIEFIICDKNQSNKYKINVEKKLKDFIKDLEKTKNKKIDTVHYKNINLDLNKTFKELNISNGTLLEIKYKLNNREKKLISDFMKIKSLDKVPPDIYLNPRLFKHCFTLNECLLEQLKKKNQLLVEAIFSEDPNLLKSVLESYLFEYRKNMNIVNNDIEYQKKIEKDIIKRNIDENMSNALEFVPESFISVDLIKIECEINHFKLIGVVDTGAQKTVMSKKLVEKLNLDRLIDKRWNGLAKGVGVAKIIGRIHIVQIKIGEANLTCSINVIDNNEDYFLLGLDMLKRHLMEIDLRKNVLKIDKHEIAFKKK